MTTAAFDGKYLVAERQTTSAQTDARMFGGTCKIEMFTDPLLATWEGCEYQFWGAAFSGTLHHADLLIKMLLVEREHLEVLINGLPCICRPDTTILLAGSKRDSEGNVTPVGLALSWRNDRGVYKLKPTFSDDMLVIGSGSNVQDFAKKLGIKTAVGAVQFASIADRYSGGQIDWIDSDCSMIHTLTIQDGRVLGGDVSVEEHVGVLGELSAAIANMRGMLLG